MRKEFQSCSYGSLIGTLFDFSPINEQIQLLYKLQIKEAPKASLEEGEPSVLPGTAICAKNEFAHLEIYHL